MDLDASLQDGFFGVSLRRHATDHGTYGSLGHGAWLSSSPHPASLRGGLALAAAQRPPLGARSASLRRQVGLGSLGMLVCVGGVWPGCTCGFPCCSCALFLCLFRTQQAPS
jgi:hypothetical protein